MEPTVRRRPLPPEFVPPKPPRTSENSKHFVSTESQSLLVEQTKNLSLNTTPVPNQINNSFPAEGFGPAVQSPTDISTELVSKAEQPKWKTAFEDVRHFAGGLLHHPVESTKHYTILRHSHGLVYYKGPSTSIAITLFSDQLIPAGRTLWLQNKGWSGKTGLKVGALFGRSAGWIDVTPAEKASTSQLPETDERAWQRDIEKFLKKAPKELRHHQARETDIVRIPAMAGDGYFRIVLCTAEGKKTLCPSPVFRLASTSTSGSSVRGASLSTLPLELGVKILSSTANTATANTLSPITNAVQNQVSQYAPSFWVQEAGTVAYDASGVGNTIASANDDYDQAREGAYEQILADTTSSPEDQPKYVVVAALGDPSGPEPPFPFRFSGRVVRGSGRSSLELGFPTANLSGVPPDIKARLSGIYFGWACIVRKNDTSPFQKASSNTTESTTSSSSSTTTAYLPCTISVSTSTTITTSIPSPTSPSPHPPSDPASIVPKKLIRVHLIPQSPSPSALPPFFDTTLSVLVLVFLRPLHIATPNQLEHDIAVTLASLSRMEWSAERAIERMKQRQKERGLSERYVDARQAGQKNLDRVPLYRVGVRGGGVEMRDRAGEWGRGGIWVERG